MSRKIDFMAEPNFYYFQVRMDENGVIHKYEQFCDPSAIYIDGNYKQQYMRASFKKWSTLMWNCGASRKGMDLVTPSENQNDQTRYMQFDDIESLNAYAGTNYEKCPLDKR